MINIVIGIHLTYSSIKSHYLLSILDMSPKWWGSSPVGLENAEYYYSQVLLNPEW